MLDSGASHSFITESVVKSYKLLVDSTKTMSIYLAMGSKVILDSIYTVSIVFCDATIHSITQHVTHQVIKKLSYDIVMGID